MITLPDNFDAKLKVMQWHEKLKNMGASEEVTDEDARQMIFDLETAYNSFTRFLHNS
ncbi:hypothetical protein WUBG_15029 [Wuchereria bancrofti]|nr:hypothetical protein WUBG_15029 [Wuchereria bancrofti]